MFANLIHYAGNAFFEQYNVSRAAELVGPIRKECTRVSGASVYFFGLEMSLGDSRGISAST